MGQNFLQTIIIFSIWAGTPRQGQKRAIFDDLKCRKKSQTTYFVWLGLLYKISGL